MDIRAPKGTKDVTPNDSFKWQFVENMFSKLCNSYGYRQIRTPVFEHTELFLRGVGETTDVVQKEMYTFLDKGDRSITLRPEGTASAVRSFLENGLHMSVMPAKLYYILSCYRYERPQSGRLREFHQFGIELFGASSPYSDVEIIALANQFFMDLKIKNLQLKINNIGCADCRVEYNAKLKEYLKSNFDELCTTCKDRFDKNPMRILDCKVESCGEIIKNAPKISDFACEACKEHFATVQKGLDLIGISYEVDKNIVRGLDYYTKTVFEFISSDIGAQSAVLGGGRYDGLIKKLGGPETCGIGFALGVERLLLLMENQKIVIEDKNNCDIFIASADQAGFSKALEIANGLRKKSISAQFELCGRSLKAQMKYADKIGTKFSIVIGENEVKIGTGTLKNMKTGETFEIELCNIETYLNGKGE